MNAVDDMLGFARTAIDLSFETAQGNGQPLWALALTQEQGSPDITPERAVTDRLEEMHVKLRDLIVTRTNLSRAAIAWDGYGEYQGRRTDALLVESYLAGETMGILVQQPYRWAGVFTKKIERLGSPIVVSRERRPLFGSAVLAPRFPGSAELEELVRLGFEMGAKNVHDEGGRVTPFALISEVGAENVSARFSGATTVREAKEHLWQIINAQENLERAAIIYDDLAFSLGFPMSILFVDAYEAGAEATINVGQRYEWSTGTPAEIELVGAQIIEAGRPPLFGIA